MNCILLNGYGGFKIIFITKNFSLNQNPSLELPVEFHQILIVSGPYQNNAFNPDPSLEIYIIRLTLRNYAVETEFFSAHLSMISLRLKNPLSPFIFLS